MRRLGAQGDATGAEGNLIRKHDWESTTKKAANRSWDKVSIGTGRSLRLDSKLNFMFAFKLGLCRGS